MAMEATIPELDAQYREIREGAALLDRSGRGKLLVRGPEAVEYLQGQLTNDLEPLGPGEGCYAALLDRKAHVLADARVLLMVDAFTGDGGSPAVWLDTEPLALEALRRHLATHKVGRDVEVEDVSGDRAIHSLLGPGAAEAAETAPLSPEHSHRAVEIAGVTCEAVATAEGIDLVCDAASAERVRSKLTGAGAVAISEEAAEIARVEAGLPRYGREITAELMPAEAGIVDRAVDFEKGCYIGQEPVARLHYRGKPNRTLRSLRLSAPAHDGAVLRLGDKVVGQIGTAVISPRVGPIALAVVRREAEPGATLAVGENGDTAEVVAD
jgi:folate-binding protein YgfZ